MLTPHFTLAEMVKSQVASRRGIPNSPPPAAITNLRTLCVHVLEPLRQHFGRPVIVSSGYRSAALNAAINGAPSSQHIRGQAADVEVLGVPNPVVWEWLQRSVVFDQLILEHCLPEDPHSGWVHVSYSSTRNRRNVLRLPTPSR
jgi:zinc D-Ala-D-Ala carboxypeptidase